MMKSGDIVNIYTYSGSIRHLLSVGIYIRDEVHRGFPLHTVLENGTGRMCYVPVNWRDDPNTYYEIEVVK